MREEDGKRQSPWESGAVKRKGPHKCHSFLGDINVEMSKTQSLQEG